MTPDKLSEIEFRARNARDFPTVNDAKDCLFIASAKGDVLDLCAALRTAWAERDKLNVLLDERNDNTDALLFDHAMREASLLEERAAREDVPWLVSEVERLRGLAVMLRKGCEDGYGHAWKRQHALTCGTCQMIRENFDENGDVR